MTSPGTGVAKRDSVKSAIVALDRPDFQEQLRQALPADVSVEKFTRVAKLSIQLNPSIAEVDDRTSLFIAFSRCAADGLLPDGRQAAIVETKGKGGKTSASYWPMIGGLRYIAANHGFSLEAHVVYSGDEFDYELGFDPHVTHRPPRLDVDRGQPIGAYAVATRLSDGRKFFEVMGRAQIDSIKAKSPSARFDWSPWNTAESEMWRKTVGKRLFKQLPLGDISESEARVIATDAEVAEATAPVPALAALPTVDLGDDEEPEQEIVDVDDVPFGEGD